ncbi:unnamed protein product [Lactuca saligna]|uniref:Uncharacterized protein n=1 Tax=Lactuca saligna TaxID=75948 RepID=A0AA35YEE1_LACSI|nr:unnamed protein product [Lactuca saligna]
MDPLSTEYRFVSIVDDETFSLHEFTSPVPKQIKDLRSVLGTGMAVFWNPSIRKSIGITFPDLSFEKQSVGIHVHVSQWSCHYTVLGFGVCPTTKDPTLVKFTRITKREPRT